MRIIQRPPVKKRTRRIMNVFSKLKRKIRQKIAVSKSNTIPASSSEQHNSTFKLQVAKSWTLFLKSFWLGLKMFILQLVNLRLYSEEVDSLFCVTVVSDHLVCPNKGLPVTVDIDKDTMEVTWVDKNSNSHVLCSHPLHTITYQFHTSFKPRLYGYTATWGNKKICLVFQAPLFSRIKVKCAI